MSQINMNLVFRICKKVFIYVVEKFQTYTLAVNCGKGSPIIYSC